MQWHFRKKGPGHRGWSWLKLLKHNFFLWGHERGEDIVHRPFAILNNERCSSSSESRALDVEQRKCNAYMLVLVEFMEAFFLLWGQKWDEDIVHRTLPSPYRHPHNAQTHHTQAHDVDVFWILPLTKDSHQKDSQRSRNVYQKSALLRTMLNLYMYILSFKMLPNGG